MISETQYQFLVDLINSNKGEYPFYVISTNYYNYVNSGDYDIYVYFSKNASRNNVYSFSGDFVVYGIRSANANSYNYSPRVSYLGTSNGVVISNYEYSYTNVEYKTYVEIPCLNTNYNELQNSFIAQSLLLGIPIIAILTYLLIKRW